VSWIELRENRQRVREALREGYVDEVVACRATAFDELVGAMNDFGYWEQLESIEVELEKDEDDVPNELLMRELAVLPLLRIPNPHQAPTYLFQDHGVLRFLGFTLAQIRDGFNDKGVRSPTGKARMRPHHRDTLYNALKAIDIASLDDFREEHSRALAEHGLLKGGVFAVDGTGLRNSDRHLVILQQAGDEPPFIVNWRVQGPGKELAAGRVMVDELLGELGSEAIEWLLMDGAYVDGAWIADLQRQGLGAMVRVYEGMNIFEEMVSLARFPEYAFEPYSYVRTVQGHKEVHEVELALIEAMTIWPSYWQAWKKESEEPCGVCVLSSGVKSQWLSREVRLFRFDLLRSLQEIRALGARSVRRPRRRRAVGRVGNARCLALSTLSTACGHVRWSTSELTRVVSGPGG